MTQKAPSPRDQAVALRWFGRQPRQVQIEGIRLQSSLIRQARDHGHKGPVTSEMLLELLAKACMMVIQEERGQKQKQRMTQEEARRVHERKVERFKAGRRRPKSSPKRDAIRLRYFSLVQSLRKKEGFGWRNCANFLKEQHGFDVSHAFLKQTIEELEGLHNGN